MFENLNEGDYFLNCNCNHIWGGWRQRGVVVTVTSAHRMLPEEPVAGKSMTLVARTAETQESSGVTV